MHVLNAVAAADPTLLISVFSALLRMLRPALTHVVSLPVGDLFVKVRRMGRLPSRLYQMVHPVSLTGDAWQLSEESVLC